ncbi:MAG TPA: hypothetical protein VHZ07_05290 [Bryobacteraceae bacterium]|nr:hypothetical protein [Bryobacteraceae bacterium]
MDLEPPQPPISPEFAEPIEDVLSTACLGATDCAVTLLDHSGNARKQLLDGFAETKRRVLATGKMQRFSAIMAGGELGVSFLALDSSKDPDHLARQLECYAIV